MANVTVSSTLSNVAVTSNLSNITVSEGNVLVANITTSQTNVSVTSTPVNVTVAQGTISIEQIRELFAVSDVGGFGSLSYFSGNGVFTYQGTTAADIYNNLYATAPIQFDTGSGTISIDEAALFSGKTTDDLNEGSTNLYYTNARVLTYIVDNGLDYNAEKVINGIESGNITLKQYQETYYTVGNVSGAVSVDVANGTVQELTAIGNISGITINNIQPGGQITLFIHQDDTGNKVLTNANAWTNWQWAGDFTTLDPSANSVSVLTVIYDGSVYNASLVRFDATAGVLTVTTDDIPEGNTNLYYTTARANTAIDNRVNKTFVDNLGVEYTSLSNLPTLLTNAQVIAYIGANDLTVGGNLEVTGNINYVNTQDLQVLDNTITLNYGNATPRDAFIYVDRSGGALTNSYIKWNETNDRWEVSDGSNTIVIGAQTVESVNGQTGAVVLDTGDIAENGNLYYTTDRANTAIDTRVTAGFVNALGVDYNSLANTPSLANVATSGDYNDLINTPVLANVATSGDYNDLINAPANISDFNNDAGYLVAANLASLTANVDSVNGQTGVVVLDTDDIAEAGNLYYTQDRANTAILNYKGNINGGGTSVDTIVASNVYINYNLGAVTAIIDDLTVNNNVYVYKEADIQGNLHVLETITAGYFNGDGGGLGNLNISLSGFTTDNLNEGNTNLYFTTDRANTAIDNRVDAAYVNALSVDYNSLANTPALANVATSGDYNDLINTPTNVSVFANDAGYLVAANLASLTANVDSVNGQTGVVVLDTGDIAENGNLYFTTDRTNTAIDAYVVGSENILVNSGVISTPNALGNVNSVTSEIGTKIDINNDNDPVYSLTTKLGANNVDTPLTTIDGGWGWLQTSQTNFIAGVTSGLTVVSRILDYTGSANVESLMFTGNATAGSNIIQLTGMETFRTVATSDVTIPITSSPIVGTGNIATLINEIAPGMAMLGGSVNQIGSAGSFFNSAGPVNLGRAYPFPAGSYITDIDTGNLTVTMSSPALESFEFTSGITGGTSSYNSGFFHAGVDPNTGFMIVFQSLYDMINTGAGSKTALGPYVNIPSINVYAYPPTGPVAGDFNWSVGSPSDYVIDWNANATADYLARFVGKVSYGAANEVITYNFQDGISIGANAQMSTSGAPFDKSSWGVKQFYDGLEDYSDFYNQYLTFQGPNITTFKPGMSLTSFTDKTFAHARPSTGGPELTFAMADGNLNDPEVNWYVKNTTELGRISWTGFATATNITPQQSAQIPFYNPGAFISVTTGSDYNKFNQPSKTNFHIAATSEPIGAGTNPTYSSVKDLFMSYDNGGLYLGAGRPSDSGRQSITFGPAAELSYFTTIGGSGSGPNNHWTSGTKRSWVEITSANVSADTGSRLTVTNGGTNGGRSTVGDMVIELNRVANTRDRLQEGTIAQLANGTNIRNGNGGGTTRFPDADTVGFYVVNTRTLTPLANGTQVYFTGSAEYVGADLIEWSSNVSNTAYVCLGRSIGVEGALSATRYYGVFKDSGFTTPLTWAEISGDTFANIFGSGGQTPIYQGLIVEYDSTAAHTAKSWSFELTEASDNLELKEDGTTVVTFDGGTVTATAFIGDGSSLTNSLVNYTTDDLTEGNTNVYFTTDRANTAIDNRVDVAFVDALGVDYNSLANVPSFANVATTGDYNDLINTPANVSDFANDAGYLVAANLASLTANVDSVNGFTGVVSLDTDDVPEGSANLYFSNARVNAFIQDSITTTDIDEGTNLYWTTDRGNSMVEAFQGNINTVGTITATSFTGDGSDLTGVRAETITEKVKNVSGGTLAKGTPVYATGGVVADVLEVAACDAGDPAKMPCIGVLSTALDDDEEGTAILAGRISGVDTSAFVPGDQLYVAVGGGYANTSPAGESNVVQFLGTVTRVDATVGGGIVHVSEPRDTDALNSGNIFIGSGANRTITATLNTSIVPESGNLYFTTDRANTAIGAYTGNIAPANVSLTKFNETVVSLGNISGDISGNLNVTNGTIFTLTTNGNITANTLTNAVAGTSATLIITNGGSHTLSSTMKFAGGSKTLSTAANAVDIISVFYDGTTYYATLSKGYV